MGILFVFVDGLGWAPPGPGNPLAALEGGPLGLLNGAQADGAFRLLAADACLGLPGLPQSATGGTSLFTGVNASALEGGHLHGMPTAPLRDLLARKGLLRRARERGARADFANAYTPPFFHRRRSRRRSVTTVMTECAGIRLKRLVDLRRGEAVYRDFTNRLLRDAGYDVELLTPEAAGARLGRLAAEKELVLYEFFQTDRVGHRGTYEEAATVLRSLNRFLAAALEELDPRRHAFILSSDHGNIEDMGHSLHTRNPVPLLMWGRAAARWPGPENGASLLDVAPGILSLL